MQKNPFQLLSITILSIIFLVSFRLPINEDLNIGIGLASLILYDAIIIGMEENIIKSATSSLLGEAQIHQKDFRITQEVEKTIQNLEGVENDLKNEEIVDKYSNIGNYNHFTFSS